MSEEDRQKWDARYAPQPVQPPAQEPSIEPLLAALAPRLPTSGRALDVAGGLGRHAFWLAERGLQTTLVDISEQAIGRVQQQAARRGVTLDCQRLDLDTAPLPKGPFEVIVCSHFWFPPLLRHAEELLAPGGWLILVQPSVRNQERHASPSARFLATPAELLGLVAGLDVVLFTTGWRESGRHEIWFAARRPVTTSENAADYRWNQAELAAAYDASASVIHPYYDELQQQILDRMAPYAPAEEFLIVDLGAGSGRLLERALERFPRANALAIDQSVPSLQIAAGRLSRFAGRGGWLHSRLQDEWEPCLGGQRPHFVISMSAIHHLDAAEKRTLSARIGRLLAAGGWFLNGDEVRPVADADYRQAIMEWIEHVAQQTAAGRVPPAMQTAWEGWKRRNAEQFGARRRSGDDCHDTAISQLQWLIEGGMPRAELAWQAGLWSLLAAQRTTSQ